MLVIHPKDRTTEMLSILYKGLEAKLIESDFSNKEMGHLLHHTSPSERIMLLGHGSDKGLYFRKNDEEEEGMNDIKVFSRGTLDYGENHRDENIMLYFNTPLKRCKSIKTT